MAKVDYIIVGGVKYNVSALTPPTLAELVLDLAKIGDDVNAVLMKYKVVRVK